MPAALAAVASLFSAPTFPPPPTESQRLDRLAHEVRCVAAEVNTIHARLDAIAADLAALAAVLIPEQEQHRD